MHLPHFPLRSIQYTKINEKIHCDCDVGMYFHSSFGLMKYIPHSCSILPYCTETSVIRYIYCMDSYAQLEEIYPYHVECWNWIQVTAVKVAACYNYIVPFWGHNQLITVTVVTYIKRSKNVGGTMHWPYWYISYLWYVTVIVGPLTPWLVLLNFLWQF